MVELTDPALSCVQPVLPADSWRSKPWHDHRQVLGGIAVGITGQAHTTTAIRIIRSHPSIRCA
jgi:hypothetical protein